MLTINGVYEYDNTIFDGMRIPKGMDKGLLINNILLECFDLWLIYNNPEFLKLKIEVWAQCNAYSWDKMFKTTQLEYNPIENYDKMEDYTDDTTHMNDEQNARTINHDNRANTEANSINSGEDNEYKNVSAFDSSSYQPAEHIRRAYGAGNDSISSITGEEHTQDSYHLTDQGNTCNAHHGRIHGNIGVTTSQQMITSERDVAKFNMYQVITQEFKENFCVLVY